MFFPIRKKIIAVLGLGISQWWLTAVRVERQASVDPFGWQTWSAVVLAAEER